MDPSVLVESICVSFKEHDPNGIILPLGSEGHGWADDHSDIDLFLCWTVEPESVATTEWLVSLADDSNHVSRFLVPSALPTFREDVLIFHTKQIHLFHVIMTDLVAFAEDFREAKFPVQSVVNELMMPFSRMHFSGQKRIQAEELFSSINVLGFEKAGSLRSECDSNYVAHEIRALWIDIDASCRDLRKYARRGAIASVTRSMIQSIRDMLWMFSLSARFHFPGIAHSARWIPQGAPFRSAYATILEILSTEDLRVRVEMFLQLVEDLDVFMRGQYDLDDVPRTAHQLRVTEAVSMGLFEPTGAYWPITQPHRLPEQHIELSERFSKVYSEKDFVWGFGQFGSIPRGLVDGWSDMDFFVLCQAYPSAQDREKIIATLCTNESRGHIYYHDSDCFWIDGIGIHVDYCIMKDGKWHGTLFQHNQQLECVARYDPKGLVKEIKDQARIDLSERTRQAILDTIRSITPDRICRVRRSAMREDVIAFDYDISELAEDIFRLISLINDMETPHPKWTERLLQAYKIKPDKAIERLRTVVLGTKGRSCVERLKVWESLHSDLIGLTGEIRPEMRVALDTVKRDFW